MTTGMTISEMLGQSGLLTLLGMVVVFSFIIILIFCMKLLRVIVHALKLDVVKENEKANSANVAQASGGTVQPAVNADSADTKIIAAIVAALHEKQ